MVAHLHGLEPAATSMLGNFMLIRENKEGAGSRGGGDMPGDGGPATFRGRGCRRGDGEMPEQRSPWELCLCSLIKLCN